VPHRDVLEGTFQQSEFAADITAVHTGKATAEYGDAVCRAFAETYVAEGPKLPSETQERRYEERLVSAYPIHPEIFDRLYENWTTIDGFQRTRGVLKLMAKAIYRLWKDDNRDAMILPASLPLYDGSSRNELVYYLPPGGMPSSTRTSIPTRPRRRHWKTASPASARRQRPCSIT
jgi:predicted AAA+ superfamily ATPase